MRRSMSIDRLLEFYGVGSGCVSTCECHGRAGRGGGGGTVIEDELQYSGFDDERKAKWNFEFVLERFVLCTERSRYNTAVSLDHLHDVCKIHRSGGVRFVTFILFHISVEGSRALMHTHITYCVLRYKSRDSNPVLSSKSNFAWVRRRIIRSHRRKFTKKKQSYIPNRVYRKYCECLAHFYIFYKEYNTLQATRFIVRKNDSLAGRRIVCSRLYLCSFLVA